MLRRLLTISIIVIAGVFLYFNAPEVKAMTRSSDLINISWPSATTSHTISFLTTAPIPPSGKIEITPVAGAFFIPLGFNYTDVDLATSSSSNGPFIDRNLDAVTSAINDGVAVVASTTSGSITITLNSTFGINTGVYVQIQLGKNATYGASGDLEIINPISVGSYRIDIRTLNSSNALIKKTQIQIATAEPVYMSTEQDDMRSLGRPVGYLNYGTTDTIISLTSNYLATCRYSKIASTSYAAMTEEFTYTTGRSNIHSVLVSDVNPSGFNTYYVRCENEHGVYDNQTLCEYSTATTTTSIVSCIDYIIQFEVTPLEDSDDDGTGTEPGPGGGGSGGGGGGGFGFEQGRGRGNLLPYPPHPDRPGVAFLGWAYPSSGVTVLQDGTDVGTMDANAQAEFAMFLPDLTQGVYTFGLWSEDKNGIRSITYSTTFWIDDGTQSTVSDIFLPPTLSIGKNSVTIGSLLESSGQSVPGSTVEVWLYPAKSGELSEDEIIKKESIVDIYGNWAISLNTNNASNGNYKVKAKSTLTTGEESDFGHALDVVMNGEPIPKGLCEGADLNQDGRVNITDFSILLYYWGTDNECADQNKSGNVDLIDFSIMMYYWTG